MSGLLFCRETDVRTPLYAKELGISLYSAEELSYYIDQYLLLLTEDFLDESLFRFLGDELGRPDLEGRVRKWMSVQKDMYQALIMIQQEIRYLSDAELNQFKKKAEQLRKAGPLELLKEKADFYIQVNQYGNAVRSYDQILKDKKLEAVMAGKVWHNRGIACIQLMQMKEAMDCLYRSWEILRLESIAHEMFVLYCMEEDISLPAEVAAAVSGEVQYRWKEDFDSVSMDAMYEGKAESIADAFNKDIIRRREALAALMRDWKQEYREMAG